MNLYLNANVQVSSSMVLENNRQNTQMYAYLLDQYLLSNYCLPSNILSAKVILIKIKYKIHSLKELVLE
jgi:hypothetical protein